MNHPEAGLSIEIPYREPEEEMSSFYTNWLDENLPNLTYDENAKKFVIKWTCSDWWLVVGELKTENGKMKIEN